LITDFCSPLGGPVASEVDRTIPGPGGDLRVRVYTPDLPGVLPVIVYFHGGGWVLYDLDTFNPICRDLANAAGAVVVAVAYRLAPEHPFPAAVDDAYATVRWVADHAAQIGGDGSRVAVAGDSAGGNLSAVTALRCRDEGAPTLAFQLIINPVTDCDLDTDSYHEFADGLFLTRDQMRWYWDHYLPDPAARTHPWASPLRADDLSGLPPAIVYTAENDPLRDEGEAFAARLAAAGVPTIARRVPGVIHGFMNLGNASEKGAAAVAEAAALRHAFDAG
jgi:acetyl esterase